MDLMPCCLAPKNTTPSRMNTHQTYIEHTKNTCVEYMRVCTLSLSNTLHIAHKMLHGAELYVACSLLGECVR